MLHLVVHSNTMSMRAYVTPQNRIIRRCAPAICARPPFLSKAWLSNSSPRKQGQVVSPIFSEDLIYKNASVENAISGLATSDGQLKRSIQGKSIAVTQGSTLVRITR